jgi:hypothetical protein
MLIPMAAPFNLVSMNVGYITTDSLYNRYRMFLPTTLLKFVQFKRIGADDFNRLFNKFKQANSVYRTAPFRLARNFPPMAVKYYMRALTDLNDYYEFLAQRIDEHKMCCVAVLMLHEDYLLKLRIRADMTFVWQVAVPTNTPEAIAHGRFLIQTLLFLFS